METNMLQSCHSAFHDLDSTTCKGLLVAAVLSFGLASAGPATAEEAPLNDIGSLLGRISSLNAPPIEGGGYRIKNKLTGGVIDNWDTLVSNTSVISVRPPVSDDWPSQTWRLFKAPGANDYWQIKTWVGDPGIPNWGLCLTYREGQTYVQQEPCRFDTAQFFTLSLASLGHFHINSYAAKRLAPELCSGTSDFAKLVARTASSSDICDQWSFEKVNYFADTDPVKLMPGEVKIDGGYYPGDGYACGSGWHFRRDPNNDVIGQNLSTAGVTASFVGNSGYNTGLWVRYENQNSGTWWYVLGQGRVRYFCDLD